MASNPVAQPFSTGSLKDQWEQIPIGEQNLLIDLAGQWDQITGYSVGLLMNHQDWLLQMAKEAIGGYGSTLATASGVMGLTGFSGWLWSHGMVPSSMPWAGVGLTRDEYQTAIGQFSNAYESLTGQQMGTDVNNPDQGFEFMWQALSHGQNVSEAMHKFKQDKAMQETYGWLKYGLDYEQLQQQKLGMRAEFGRDLSDQEAVTQLQYLHQASGSSYQAQARPPQQDKAAGVGQSVIR